MRPPKLNLTPPRESDLTVPLVVLVMAAALAYRFEPAGLGAYLVVGTGLAGVTVFAHWARGVAYRLNRQEWARYYAWLGRQKHRKAAPPPRDRFPDSE